MNAIPNQRHLYMGTFEAEAYWRDTELASLPALPDRASSAIVAAMDELLFSFCQPGDALLTRYAISPVHRQYIAQLGFHPAVNERDLTDGMEQAGNVSAASVFELLSSRKMDADEGFPQLEGCVLSPFAGLPHVEEAARAWGITLHQPPLETIRKVNAKTYSSELKRNLGLRNPGHIVTSFADVAEAGRKLLRDGSFLIKDDFGVSGKGNLHITSTQMLDRVVAYLRGQERKGKRVLFLLEPFLEKEQDFSCQFTISDDGRVDIISVQWLANTQFAYRESLSPDRTFMERLERDGYFSLMQDVGQQLYRDGYYGDVCIDSMTLRGGKLEPIIEINARKSMSLIKHQLDTYLAGKNMHGTLTNYSLSHDGSLSYEELLEGLKDEGLLFTGEREEGVMPLGANTLYVNTGGRDGENKTVGHTTTPSRNTTGRGGRSSAKQVRVSGIGASDGGPEGNGMSQPDLNGKQEADGNERARGKGRLYLELVAASDEEKIRLTTKLERFLAERHFTVLN
ncbi:hypothetical protein [Paenibacillus polymyxa]|uniref:hypothetical protein n=1 Tax=Paenibacillus TaxID=44249 RepID=UPI001F596D61|nr:hypothetical protein [Paenibacillus polymyxa]UNL93678.1 hypothetical protein CPY53_08935 [Paenibacillus polymyxa]UQQ34358.1 hypothetical protein LMH85_19250 [Paenibacillus polymyxa]